MRRACFVGPVSLSMGKKCRPLRPDDDAGHRGSRRFRIAANLILWTRESDLPAGRGVGGSGAALAVSLFPGWGLGPIGRALRLSAFTVLRGSSRPSTALAEVGARKVQGTLSIACRTDVLRTRGMVGFLKNPSRVYS